MAKASFSLITVISPGALASPSRMGVAPTTTRTAASSGARGARVPRTTRESRARRSALSFAKSREVRRGAMMEFDSDDIAYRPTTGVRRLHETPLIAASESSLMGYGALVEDPHNFPIEIVRWPAQGWRQIDANSGNQGGVTQVYSTSGGRARRCMRATTRLGTATCSAGAIGPKRPRTAAPRPVVNVR